MSGGDVDVLADTDGLLMLLIECRDGVVLMSGMQGSLGVFEEIFARACKNELSVYTRVDGQGDKQSMWRLKGASQ